LVDSSLEREAESFPSHHFVHPFLDVPQTLLWRGFERVSLEMITKKSE
jgi:hypothetical protein